jgi:AraC-like DNA-binding protein
MPESILFHRTGLAGLEAMSADTARSFPRHTHDQYGIGVIDRGAQASASDARQVEAGPGDLIFVNPGEVHDGRARDGKPRAWRMLYLDPALLQQAREDVLESRGGAPAFPAPVASDAPMRALFDALHTRLTRSGGTLDAMAGELAVLRLAAGLEHRLLRGTLPPRHDGRIARARERIDDAPAAALSLAGLAEDAGMSRFQLHRAFLRELGLSPHAYILQQRLALARRLIRAGTPLAETALAAGFCDQSHLSRCFARAYGVPPGRYARPRPAR